MVCLSISRYYSYTAAKKINIVEPDAALKSLNKSFSILPSHIFQADLQHIHTLFGKTYLELAEQSEKNANLKHALMHFSLAVNLDLYDVKSAKGFALTAGLLEPQSSKNALALYNRLAELRPNGISVHYMIAEYLYKKGLKKELADTVEYLAMISPGDALNGDFKKAVFYTPDMQLYIRKGLEKAVKRNINQRTAFFALAKFSESKNKWTEAVDLYQKAMKLHSYRNKSSNYYHLGRLFLNNNEVENAFKSFEKGLAKTQNFDKDIRQIYKIFKRQNAYGYFDIFANKIEGNNLVNTTLDLYVAKARMQLGLNELARARLLRLVSSAPIPEAYYLLSVIAKRKKDWDAMELNIQKAISLSPGTCHYYNIFAAALFKQGKHIQAEIQRVKAGQCLKIKK